MHVGVYYSLPEAKAMLALLKEINRSPKEIGLLKRVSGRDTAKMFSSTKHLIAMTKNKRRNQTSCEDMAKIRAFSERLCDHMLIPSTCKHSKPFKASVDKHSATEDIPEQIKTKIGEYRVKIGRVRLYSIVRLTHSTQ